MIVKRTRPALVALTALLALVLLTGCSAAVRRSDRPSDDWSRGVRLGQASLNVQMGLATEASGEHSYLVWIAREQDGNVLRFARVDRAGKVLVEKQLDVAPTVIGRAELAIDALGQLHLFWTARSEHVYQIWYALVDDQGNLVTPPAALPLGEAAALDVAISPDAQGACDLFWLADEASGKLRHVKVGADGGLLEPDTALRDSVTEANVRRDRNGVLRVAWMEEPTPGEIKAYYATYDAGARTLLGATELGRVSGATGLVQRGPELGLAGDYAYVLWSVERRGGGLTQSSSETFYSAFPIDQPELAGKVRQVLITVESRPAYQTAQALGQTRQLAPPATFVFGGRSIYMPATPQQHRDELVTSLAVNVQGRTRDTVQVMTLFWAQGELRGYQLAGKTATASLESAIAVDAANNVHLAWIDTGGFGRYDLYYAGTAPEARANLNRVSLGDVLGVVMNLGWALTGSLAFFPVAFMWITIPLAVVAIYLVISAEGDLMRRGPRIMLAVGALIYLLLKYASESSWLVLLQLPGLPEWLSAVLVAIAPLLVGGLAALVTWLVMRRREYLTLFRVFVTWTALDALITFLLYVPILMIE
ncbi:MAG: cbb3-type cytochrome c oxidase subunit I [Chloroflexi bacterium]|nr:cbb3-type cytochrome c oxidase subunit I [Chloroflexota bacterium]